MNLKQAIIFTALVFLIQLSVVAQQPRYTRKSFVSVLDTSEFKLTTPVKDGFVRSYVRDGGIQVFDLDDDSTTYIMGSSPAIVCFEGQMKNNKKEGVFKGYLIDSTDHTKRYKIYEQQYANDMLNGQWRTYTLRGGAANYKTFLNDSVNGPSVDYWIDGKTIMNETDYFNGHNKCINKSFYKNGKEQMETPYLNGKVNGLAKKFYEDGTIQESAEFTDNEFNGMRKYYYPNGQVWIEEIYKHDKHWTVVGNYTDRGVKRNPGTLREGNGTLLLYDEDGSVRETQNFKNGQLVNN